MQQVALLNNRYQVLEILGAGVYGEVFMALDTFNDN